MRAAGENFSAEGPKPAFSYQFEQLSKALQARRKRAYRHSKQARSSLSAPARTRALPKQLRQECTLKCSAEYCKRSRVRCIDIGSLLHRARAQSYSVSSAQSRQHCERCEEKQCSPSIAIPCETATHALLRQSSTTQPCSQHCAVGRAQHAAQLQPRAADGMRETPESGKRPHSVFVFASRLPIPVALRSWHTCQQLHSHGASGAPRLAATG